MTTQYRHAMGENYPDERFIISMDFNLEDLYWLLDCTPVKDAFQKDVQEGIDWIEKMKEVLGE